MDMNVPVPLEESTEPFSLPTTDHAGGEPAAAAETSNLPEAPSSDRRKRRRAEVGYGLNAFICHMFH